MDRVVFDVEYIAIGKREKITNIQGVSRKGPFGREKKAGEMGFRKKRCETVKKTSAQLEFLDLTKK